MACAFYNYRLTQENYLKTMDFSGHHEINRQKHRNFMEYNTPQKICVLDVVYLYTYIQRSGNNLLLLNVNTYVHNYSNCPTKLQTPNDWLNNFYSCYMAAVVDIINEPGLGIVESNPIRVS